MSWQRSSGYNRRSLVETTMFRYEIVIGRRLPARTLPNQRIEAKVGCIALNRLTGLAACRSPLGSADTQTQNEEHNRRIIRGPTRMPGIGRPDPYHRSTTSCMITKYPDDGAIERALFTGLTDLPGRALLGRMICSLVSVRL
jgi:hypothetical protein